MIKSLLSGKCDRYIADVGCGVYTIRKFQGLVGWVFESDEVILDDRGDCVVMAIPKRMTINTAHRKAKELRFDAEYSFLFIADSAPLHAIEKHRQRLATDKRAPALLRHAIKTKTEEIRRRKEDLKIQERES